MVQRRPLLLMPAKLHVAAVQCIIDVLVQLLGLPHDQEGNNGEVHIDVPENQDPPPGNDQIQSNIRSATRSGDTILHLLIIFNNNEVALKVFQKYTSLLQAKNNKSETPLHCAARVGNIHIVCELIRLNREMVAEALNKTDANGDTALHVGVKHGNGDIASELMKLVPTLAYEVNNEGSSPLFIAILNRYTETALAMLKEELAMLKDEANLARLEDSDGMLPIHVAARLGDTKLLKYFIKEHADCARLLDPRGRNLFHIAAEANRHEIFDMLVSSREINRWTNPIYYHYYYLNETNPRGSNSDCTLRVDDKIKQMINARDYEGNTPLHIAAMKGHVLILRAIWEKKIDDQDAEENRNKQGFTPLELFSRQLKETCHHEDNATISCKMDKYIASNGNKFTRKLFTDAIKPPNKNVWNKLQVIGLGAVLIITLAFAAAFTIPGGYNQATGTPVLGRRHMFRAFILANALAFITAFMSLFSLLLNSIDHPDCDAVRYSTLLFLVSSSSMVVAFGLGMYVTLAPDNMSVAIVILVSGLFIGSPFGHLLILLGKNVTNFFMEEELPAVLFVSSLYVLLFLWIFCVSFLH